MNVCSDCAHEFANTFSKEMIWQDFLQKVFDNLKIEKLVSTDEMNTIMSSLKNHNDLNEFLGGLLQSRDYQNPFKDVNNCSSCDMKFEDIIKHGKVGCGNCYSHFSEYLMPIIIKSQEGASRHVGKIPKQRAYPSSDILVLKRELGKAISEERYEDAANFRDQIKKIEAET